MIATAAQACPTGRTWRSCWTVRAAPEGFVNVRLAGTQSIAITHKGMCNTGNQNTVRDSCETLN